MWRTNGIEDNKFNKTREGKHHKQEFFSSKKKKKEEKKKQIKATTSLRN